MAVKLTPEQYSNQFIDFYNQYLGLPKMDTIFTTPEPEPEDEGLAPSQQILEERGIETMSPSQEQNIVSGMTVYSGTNFQGVSNIGQLSSEVFDPSKSLTKDRVPLLDASAEVVAGYFSKDIKMPTMDEAAKTAGAAVVTGITGAAGSLAFGPLIGGEQSTNAFGKTSFRPSGMPGFAFDMVKNLQSKDIAAIKAAQAAQSTTTGFAATFGNYGITRAPGSGTYTGNMQGLTHGQMKAIEAINKGYTPNSYNMTAETGDKIADSGGVTLGGTVGGYYAGDGSYVSATGQGSAYGSMSAAAQLGQQYGVSTEMAVDVLGKVRSGQYSSVAAGMEIAKSTLEANQGVGTTTPSETTDVSENYGAMSPEDVAAQQQEAAQKAAEAAAAQKAAEAAAAQKARENRQRDNRGRDGGGGAAGGATGGKGDQGKGSGWGGMAQGGRVGLQAGGVAGQMAGQSGFVDQPPSQVPDGETVADNVETQLPEGAFVINAAAVEFAGEQDIKKMLLDAHGEAVRRGLTVDKQGNGAKMIDVAISRGEVVVAPHLAKIIGLDRLQKINNRGKRETQERIQENGQEPMGAAQGMLIMGRGDNTSLDVTAPTGFEEGTLDTGFLGSPPEYQPPTDVGEDVPMEEAAELPEDFANRLEQHFGQGVSRTRNDKFYRSLSEQELLAHLIVAETKAAGADPDDMYAVGQTVINRINSDRPEFKNKKTVADVALSRLQKGGYEYTGMDVTRNKAIQEEFKSTPENIRNGYARAYVIAGDLLSGEMEASPIVGPDIMWYTRKDAQNKWMQKNLDFVDTYGLHDFYKAPK